MKCFHLTWSSDGRHPLFPDEASRRAAVRTLARVAGNHLVVFCIVDDHVHAVVLDRTTRVGVLARALLLALRPLCATPLEPAHVRPVRNRGHLHWLVDHYILGQPAKHGLRDHPALYSGSCFPDLIGARAVPGLSLQLWNVLPRYRLRRAHRAVGLPEQPLLPAPDVLVHQAGATRLVHCVTNAAAVDPTLPGRTRPVVRARRAAIHLLHHARIPHHTTAETLAITPRTVGHALATTPDPLLLSAARIQLTLLEIVRNPHV